MPTFKVAFNYTRTVVTHLEADSDEAIEDFLEDNEDWDLLDGHEELIDSDETQPDAEYTVEAVAGVTADFALIDSEIVEVGP